MKINIFGFPSHAGALNEGTELAPAAIRNAGLAEKLRDRGISVEDHGDILDSRVLPRHNICPVRNWPAPRMVWDETLENADQLFSRNFFSILLGGDCSIEVGTFPVFRKAFGDQVHLLVLDGHVDTVAPSGERCVGAAGMGLWFLTQDSQVWCKERPFKPENITVIGPQEVPHETYGIKVIPFDELSMNKIADHLRGLPEETSILVHFDVDVLQKEVMPSAYSPSEKGLSFEGASEILKLILKDVRVKGIEVTEFSANKDEDGKSAKTIVDLLCLVCDREESHYYKD